MLERFVVHLDRYGSEDIAGTPWTGTLTAAGVDVRTFHGKPAKECQEPVREVWDSLNDGIAAARLSDSDRAQYESAEQLLAQLETHPGATVRVEKARETLCGIEEWAGTLGDDVCVTEGDGQKIPVSVMQTGGEYRPLYFAYGKWREPVPDFGYRIMAAWAMSRAKRPDKCPLCDEPYAKPYGDLPRSDRSLLCSHPFHLCRDCVWVGGRRSVICMGCLAVERPQAAWSAPGKCSRCGSTLGEGLHYCSICG